jgi:hypothetical protein
LQLYLYVVGIRLLIRDYLALLSKVAQANTMKQDTTGELIG